MPSRTVQVEPQTLPLAVTPPVKARIGVVYPESLRTARPETLFSPARESFRLRHDIGTAAVDALRQGLRAGFSDVVELDRLPDEQAPRPDLSGIVVPSIELMSTETPANSVIAVVRHSLRLSLELHSPAGAPTTKWQVEGTAALDAHGPTFRSGARWDQAILRSAMAALIASIHQDPALASIRLPTVAVEEPPHPAATQGANGAAVVIRLDAGLARDDGIEVRMADCLAPVIPTKLASADPQPAAALRDRLFPWFEPGTAPRKSAQIEALLARPEVQAQLREVDVTHLVLITARDAEQAVDPRLLCAAGFGAGACFGIFKLREGYVVDLAVWDVNARRALDTTAADFSRTIGAVGVVLPIPFTTYGEACKKIREVVSQALPSQPQKP